MGGDNAVPVHVSSDHIAGFKVYSSIERGDSYLTSGMAVEAGRVLTRAPNSLAFVMIIVSVVC